MKISIYNTYKKTGLVFYQIIYRRNNDDNEFLEKCFEIFGANKILLYQGFTKPDGVIHLRIYLLWLFKYNALYKYKIHFFAIWQIVIW